MVSLGLLGAAALHPGIRHFDQRSDTAPPDASPARLGVLAFAVLMAPGVQFIVWLLGKPLNVPLTAAACAVMFLLVHGPDGRPGRGAAAGRGDRRR